MAYNSTTFVQELLKTSIITIDSGEDQQWLLKVLGGKLLLISRIFIQSQHTLLLFTKRSKMANILNQRIKHSITDTEAKLTLFAS